MATSAAAGPESPSVLAIASCAISWMSTSIEVVIRRPPPKTLPDP
jgi:hypothetical protein